MSTMFIQSLKTEVNLKIQDYRFFLSAAFIAILVFIATPRRDTGFYPLVINDYTSYYSSAFLGLYSAVLTGFFFSAFGVYLVIGRVSEDYTSGVGQVLASTHMRSSDYILTRVFSHVLTLITLDTVAILTSIFLQFYHGEVKVFNLMDHILPHLVYVWPIAILVSFIAVFLELYFRNRLQAVYLGYFFLIVPILSIIMIPGEFDVFGFYAYGQYLKELGLVSSYTSVSLLAGGEDLNPIFIDFPGVAFTTEMLLSRLIILALAPLFFLASVFRFDRFDSSKWSISLSKMLNKDKKETEILPIQEDEVPIIHYPELPLVSRSTNWKQYLILIKAEFFMTLVRSKFYYATLVIITIIAITESSPVMIIFTLFLAVIPLAKLFSKDLNQGSAELLLTMPQAERKVVISRLTAGIMLLTLSNTGLFISYLSSGNFVRIGLVVLTSVFVVSMAFGLTSFLRQDKAFLIIFVTWWYLAINSMPGSDFLFLTINTTNVIIYSVLTVFFVLMGILGQKINA